MKLLFRGGSIPAGRGASRSYVDMLQDALSDKKIEVINRSRVLDTSFEGVWSFYEDIDLFKPDLLILHFGIDDIYRPVYRSEFKENLVQIVRLARARFNPVIFLLTSHPFENQYDIESVNIYYRTIREVAFDLECVYIPVHMLWLQYMQDRGKSIKDLVQEDSRFPNNEGQEIYYLIVRERIGDLLSKKDF